MKYLATIYFEDGTSSKYCKSDKEARQWLDSQNNNLKHKTKIERLNDNWEMIDSYIYTEKE